MDCVKNDSAAQIHFSLLILKYKYLLCLFRWRKNKNNCFFFFLSSWLYMVLASVSPSFFSEFPHFRLTPFSFFLYDCCALHKSGSSCNNFGRKKRKESLCVAWNCSEYIHLFIPKCDDRLAETFRQGFVMMCLPRADELQPSPCDFRLAGVGHATARNKPRGCHEQSTCAYSYHHFSAHERREREKLDAL